MSKDLTPDQLEAAYQKYRAKLEVVAEIMARVGDSTTKDGAKRIAEVVNAAFDEISMSELIISDKVHDHACSNCFTGKGNCLGECHVTDINKALPSSFEDVVKPVIKWLNENSNPHASVIIEPTSAVLLSGEIGIQTKEFLKD